MDRHEGHRIIGERVASNFLLRSVLEVCVMKDQLSHELVDLAARHVLGNAPKHHAIV